VRLHEHPRPEVRDDLHPDEPNVVVASVCSGHGFKFAPVVGEILADLAESGETTHPIDFLRYDRFAIDVAAVVDAPS
jgi:glycine/D-amino acid oxidase-like deaminating enzyme